MRGIRHENGWHVAPSLGFLERSRQKFIGSLFPIPIPLLSFVQIRSVFQELYQKVSSRLSAIKVKGAYSFSRDESHHRAMGHHLPHGITQCYLPPDTSDAPRLNPSQQAGTRFTYPGGIQGSVDLGYPATHRPGVELAISRSQVRRPNHYTTEPPQ